MTWGVRVGSALFESLQDLEAGSVRQSNVQDDQIGTLAAIPATASVTVEAEPHTSRPRASAASRSSLRIAGGSSSTKKTRIIPVFARRPARAGGTRRSDPANPSIPIDRSSIAAGHWTTRGPLRRPVCEEKPPAAVTDGNG